MVLLMLWPPPPTVGSSVDAESLVRCICVPSLQARLISDYVCLSNGHVLCNTAQHTTMSTSLVTFQTSMGDVTFELYQEHAPKACQNFYELAKRGYYNGTIFHRIVADFMIQGGDPTGTGRGGTSVFGQKFEDEIKSELRFVGAGILAMANSGPNTNGSQFFITLAPTPYLDGKHTIFGRVSKGMRVVQRLGAVDTDAQDRPREEIKIFKVFIPEV
ncbi:unnamed protein product [Rhizoctonia solani]|uniref:Peptidyl-prolyl cis-trans isomerase n=1 Tax=Rhizoctonia solani TaxID=456999 RepID=A0A8H3AFA4_9AGAM|nr:unnamed protein product [Rhizoctonia solani]